MTEMEPMSELYQRLQKAGLPTSYVSRMLPEWWSEDAAKSPGALMELKMLLSRAFNLDLKSLFDDSQQIAFRPQAHCKFKHAANTQEHELDLARSIATAAARIAIAASKPQDLPRMPAAEVRRQILATGRPYVDFRGLLEFCWQIGIPVVHISKFPPKTKKMHALAVNIDGRHAIVLSLNRKASAWLLFHLAHELGHVLLGHVETNGVLIDQEVDPDNKVADEGEANEFAVEVITGSPRREYRPTGRWLKGERLAQAAQAKALSDKVDPGHIALSYANHLTNTAGGNFFSVAQTALNILEPDANAPRLVHEFMKNNLDEDEVPEDSYSHLLKVAGTE